VVPKVKKKFSVSKQAAHKFYLDRFNIMYLNELNVRREYQIRMSNRFATVENLNDSTDINSAWGNIEENVKSSAKNTLVLNGLKQHKPWFDEECLRF
jgi:hypothetical protein